MGLSHKPGGKNTRESLDEKETFRITVLGNRVRIVSSLDSGVFMSRQWFLFTGKMNTLVYM